MTDPALLGFTPGVAPQPEATPVSGLNAYVSGFFLENDVTNAYQLLTREQFKEDPLFDSGKRLKADGLWEMRNHFAGTRSDAEYDSVLGRLKVEQRRRTEMTTAGWPGYAGAVTGGLLSPTMFIPFVGQAKGFKAFAEASMLAMGAGALQELPLQMNQEERTMAESVFSVLGQTALGGVLGGLVKNLSKADIAEAVSSMVGTPGVRTIPKLAGDGGLDVQAVTKSFKVSKNFDAGADTPFIRAADTDGPTIEIASRNGVVVTPEVLDFIGHASDVAPEAIIAQLRAQNFDAVIFEGFDQAKLAGKFSKLEDGIAVLDKKMLKLTDEAKAEYPSFKPSLAFGGAAAGSQTVFRPTGGMRTNAFLKLSGLQRLTETFNPVLEAVEQSSMPKELRFETSRFMAQQMGTGGLAYEDAVKGMAVAKGGTIENRAQTHYGLFQKATDVFVEQYQAHAFGPAKPFLPGTFTSARREKGKLSRDEFAEEVSRALTNGDVSPNGVEEASKAAAGIRKEFFEPFLVLGEEAGLFKNLDKTVGDKSYLTRVYDPQEVAANRPELIRRLTAWYSGLLQADYVKALEKELFRQKNAKQFEEDTMLPGEQAALLREKILDDLKKKELARSKEELFYEDQLALTKERIKDLKEKKPFVNDLESHASEIEKLQKEATILEERLGPEYEQTRVDKRALRKRLAGLNKNKFILDDRRAAKIEQASRIEEQQLASLGRMSRSVQRVQATAASLGPDVLAQEVRLLKDQFAGLAKTYDKGEERLVSMGVDEDVGELIDRQFTKAEKLTDLAERLDDVENFDQAGWKALADDAEQVIEFRTNQINNRRAARQERLRAEADALSPEAVKAKLAEVKKKNRSRRDAFVERWRVRGLDDVVGTFEGEAADFTKHAKERATEVADAMGHVTNRMPTNELTIGKRGPELARVLTIPTKEIDFVLERDVEKIMRIYAKTMSADVEIAKRFDDVNATTWFNRLKDEYAQKSEALGASGKNPELLKKQQVQLKQHYERQNDILTALMERLRGIRGLPENADGVGYRAGRAVMTMNVLRYMGMVVPTSVTDPAAIIMKHGLVNTFKDSFIPLITNYKGWKIGADEAKFSGGDVEHILHTRALSMAHMGDEIKGNTKFERGLDYMGSKFGVISGIDAYTSGMKQLAAKASVSQMMRHMKIFMEGGKGSDEAMKYLADLGLEAEHVERIWNQVVKTPGGGNKVDGNWHPNTESWTDAEAKTLFRQGLIGRLESTIIKPGVELPLWMDKNIGYKMLGQFKTFGFSAHSKLIMAGLQQPDMALVNGTLVSLALGSLSYYLWAVATGGDALDEANEFDPAKWADESIARSFLLGPGIDAWEVAQRLPWIGPNATFSGQRTRRQGMDLVGLAGGPSADFLDKIGQMLSGLDDPTKANFHAARQMVMYQNHVAFRRALDAVEGAVTDFFDIPERRQ